MCMKAALARHSGVPQRHMTGSCMCLTAWTRRNLSPGDITPAAGKQKLILPPSH